MIANGTTVETNLAPRGWDIVPMPRKSINDAKAATASSGSSRSLN